MSFQTVQWQVADGVGRLTLNRPERLNAFTADMHRELRQVFGEARETATIRAVLVTGAGRGFCAGADLSSGLTDRDADGRPDLGAPLERDYNPLIKAMRDLPKPIVAAVNGPAAGAGMSLALACDLVLAARSATFLQAFCHLSLVPDAGSTWFLPRLAGSANAMALAMLGEKISAAEAQAMGLIWKVCEDADLMLQAETLAARLAQGPTRGYALIKRAMNESAGNSLSAQLDLERQLQREAGHGSDFAEGVAAFLQKRPPRFKGV